MNFRSFVVAALVSFCCFQRTASQPNIDGGRGDLPGMKQDMFDQVQRNKRGGQQKMMKGPPECPAKADKMSAFASMAFADGDWFVRLNSTEGPCFRLITVGGRNYSELRNASLTCGPSGEWKKRIAEEMSMVFWQANYDWVKSENETIEVVTEEGTFEVEVNEEKYASLMQCWKQSCDCEQAKSPKARIFFFTLLAVAVTCLGWDSIKLFLDRGKKPSKNPVCKKGHKIVKVRTSRGNVQCDLCNKRTCDYACEGSSCQFDLCEACYEKEKKEARKKYKEWLSKHPEDPDNQKKKSKKSKDDDEDDDDKKDSQSEAGDNKDSKKESEAESDPPADQRKESEAESDAPPASEDKDETGVEDNDNTEKATDEN